MRAFIHQPHPGRAVFGPGVRSRIAEELATLGVARPLLVGLEDRVAEAKALLGASVAGTIVDVVMHVPIERAEAARRTARELDVDGLVAIGGGSAIGLAKAIALDLALPIVAIPTTFAGSEMTSVWGLTENDVKRTGRDERVRPKTVLYDPELATTMPPRLAATSGLNALAHAVEALYAPRLDPVIEVIAEESIRALAAGLPKLAARPGDVDASGDVLYGAWLAGICLDGATLGIHHKLCHTLGGTFKLPHADVHAVILPYAAAFNRDAAPEAMRRLARGLGASDGPSGLSTLARAIGAPQSLEELGMKAADLDRAADVATQNPYENPRPVDRASVRELLEAAQHGRGVPP